MYQNLVCSVHGYKAAGSGMAVQFTMLVFMEFSVLICYRQNLENTYLANNLVFDLYCDTIHTGLREDFIG